IVANPYGITCNGCGFINTPQATLTTGKPIVENGQLTRYQVDQGSVTIEGAGLNANNVDRFEIITRSARINAEIQAKNLTIVAGRNDVDAATLKATARADDGSAKPQLAIDSSALGGMYAGAIKLVGTEAGVGVKLDGKMIASGGDIQLDANGHLRLAQTAAAGAVTVKAASLDAQGPVYAGTALTVKTQGDLTSQNNLVARDSIRLDSGGTLRNNGIIEAGVNADNTRNTSGDVTLTARQLNNGGKTVAASRDLTVTTTDTLNNQAGTLSGQRKTTVTAKVVDNRAKGRILGNTETHLAADQVLNGSGGLINSQGTLQVTAGHLDNSAGELSSLNTATLVLGSLDNLTGLVMTGKQLDITATGTVNNQGGELSTQGLMTLNAGSLNNFDKGTVAANGNLVVTATKGGINNGNNGLIASRNAELKVTAASLDNAKGTLQGKGMMTVDIAGDIDNQAGSIIAQDANLNVFASNLDNRGGVLSSVKAALEARVSGVLKNGYDLNGQGGTIQAKGLTLDALAGLFNDGGRIAAQAGDAVLNTGSASFNNSNGGLYASGKVKVDALNLDNSRGQISGGQIDLNLNGILDNTQGIIEGDSSLDVLAASLVNHNGQLRTLGRNSTTVFSIGGLFDNSNGTLETVSSDVGFTLGSLNNQSGKLRHIGAGAFGLNLTQLGAVGGSLVTYGTLVLDADSWTNSTSIQAEHLTVNVNHLTQTATGQLLSANSFNGSGIDWRNDGLIGSDGLIDVQLTGQYAGNGRLSSLGTLGLKAALIDLEENASIAGGGATTVHADGIFNNRGRVTSAAGMNVTAQGINNYGTLGSAGLLSVGTGALLNEKGLIFSGADMALKIDRLINLNADIYSLGNLSIDRDGLGALATSIVNSSGSLQSDGNMSLAASTIENVRTVLNTHDAGIYTASIREIACIEGVNAGDCSGGKENHVWQIIQRDKFEVTEASARSSITTGGNLTIQANSLTNRSSTIGAGGSFTARLDSLDNIGIETHDTETSRTFMSERTRNPDGWRTLADTFTDKYWFQSPGYSTANLAGLEADMSRFIGTTERELLQFGSSRALSQDTQTYAAIMQSGGPVDVRVQGVADNKVIRGGYNYVGAGPRTDTGADGQFSTRITVNQQLSPDLAQQQVNPVTLPGFDLPTGQNGLFRLNEGTGTPTQGSGLTQVRGLPDRSFQTNPQKYLIETNPALTDMRRFMSSDYLLTNLGYDPDDAAKRLGDGFYEQRLIQQAVIARTGQRFLDGQTSDEGMFKYLMNNAIASKDALNLTLGVSLTGEQVAALTHDIVWMETQTVNGQQVLVPVLYLANANHRLAPNGALIQGSDVTLIAGKNLNNAGTLRASNNLVATANDSLVNSGLLEAGNRLDALASNDLTNRAGGVIAGRDVNVVALTGDVVNERTVTTHESSSGYRTERTDFIDSAARIEAANNLTVSAGRDINNVGGVLKSGNDTILDAKRDVNLVAAERITSGTRGRHRDQDIKQYGSSLEVGRDLTANAGRDLNVIASQIDAKRDIAMAAAGNLTLASAADEQHSYGKSKKVTSQEDHVSQVASTINAGRNVALRAGQDLAMIASKVNAANEAYFVAGGKLALLAAQDSDYSLYDMKKKGGWGSLKMQRDEVTQITHIGSQIQTGGDLTLKSGGDQRYQVAKLQSGKNLILESGGAIAFEGVKDLHDESHTKTDNNAFWNSAKGKGNTDETLRQTQMVAAGDITIKAVEGLKIDIKHVDQQTVSQTIDAMVKADPQLAWIKEAEQRGDVDWRQVKEIHESFKYNTSGLGPASQLIIAIALAAVMGPMMAGMNTMLQAGALTVATKATVSTIDNRGNLGAIVKDVTSKDSLKGYAVSMATAGVTQGLGYEAGNVGFNAESVKTVAMKVAADAAIKTAVYGGSYKDNLATSLVGTATSIGGAYGAGKIGDLPLTEGDFEKVLLHSALGGLMAEAMGGDFRTGAIAGGANEVLIGLLGDTLLPSHLKPGTPEYTRAQENLVALSKVVGVLGAAASNGDVEIAAQVAENGTRYNFLGNHSQAERDRALKEYEETKSLDAAKKMMVLQGADQRSDGLLERFHADPASLSPSEKTELAAYLQVYGYEQSLKYGEEAARTSIDNLLKNGPVPYRDYPFAGGTTKERIAYADGLRAQDGVSVANIFWSRDQSASEMLYRDAQGYLRINREMQAMSDVGSPALYFLTGNLGTTIRVAAAANGVLQAGRGAGQVYDGDTWNGIGNIVVGAMNAASLGIPKIGSAGRVNGSAGTKTTATTPDPIAVTKITDEMEANPYHADWQRYVGNEPRAVGADVVIDTNAALGRIEPPIPKVDVTNEFMMSVSNNGGTTLRYGNPDGVAGLVVNVDKAGVLGFDIRAAQNHPLYDASGTDMFVSAMQRLGNEGIQVNQIRGAWVAGTDSVNTAKYLQNIANGMTKENAALNTWTGQISQKYGYTKVEKIESIGGITYVTFGK
ncbi:hypothetical protein EGM97_07220, partial [Pseudomonas sp. AF32]|uniref:two-partner secretion domain-containing protein n=1 Tax=Pseudomonas sp. AF32 TaxID=554390 RepID=UPI001EEE74DA